MKLFILILLLFVATISMAQSVDSIGVDAHKQLENKFKALSTFYIDETGLVVYEDHTKDSESGSIPFQIRPIGDNEIRVVSESISNSSDNEDEDESTDTEDASLIIPPIKKIEANSSIDTPIIDVKVDLDKNIVTATDDNSESELPYEVVPPLARPVTIVEENVKGDQNTNLIITKEDKPLANKDLKEKDTTTTKVAPQGSIFDRKRKSEYKNMEEAALAVESLLEELKKEQVSLKSSGSMSTRLAKGVTKDLRKRDSNRIKSSYSESTDLAPKGNEFEYDEQTDNAYGVEPTYYINGVQVDKAQINRLSKEDIINREIRVKNTVSDNPNGEIWYTVKESAIYQ